MFLVRIIYFFVYFLKCHFSFPEPYHFQVEAAGVGKVRHKRLVNLIGCCAEGDERLLVAEYMPHDTLSKHLFHCMTSNLFLLCLAACFIN